MRDETPYTIEELKSDSLGLATMTSGYFGNLDNLRLMQELAKKILKGLGNLNGCK